MPLLDSEDLVDWAPAAAGSLLVALSILHVLTEEEELLVDAFEVAIPLLVGIAFVVLAPRFHELPFSLRLKVELLGTAVLGAAVLSGVVVWGQILFQMEGIVIPPSEQQQTTFNGVAVGLFLGGLIGFYRARATHRFNSELQANRSYEEIFEKVEDGIYITDPDAGKFLEINRRGAELLGYDDPEEVVGMRVEQVSADSPEFDQEEAVRRMQRAMAGEPQQLDWLVERKDGSALWVQVSLKRAIIDGEERLLAIVRDISDRKEYETRLERQNEEMEFFNSLLRHDVLNGITVIRTRGARLAKELDGTQKEYAETVVEWSDNVTHLVQRVRDVLDTLTGEAPCLEPTDLSTALTAQVESVAKTYPEVEVETDVPDGVTVEANEFLPDVFKNLLTNDVEHNEREGLRIESSVEVGEETATVRVADNGQGVPDDLKAEVFRRGATGGAAKRGSGFGLFFVHAMVTAYGGTVHVEDNEIGGATFVIELSLAERP